MTITTRPLGPYDLEACLEFANELVEERRLDENLGLVSFEDRYTLEKEKEFLDGVVSEMSEGNLVGVAAFDGSRMIGNCDISRGKFSDTRHSGVLGIVVSKEYRGSGLGTRLMQETLAKARTAGITLVELDVFATNPRAIRFYERAGFKRVGMTPRKILREGKYIDSLRMFIDIGDQSRQT